MNLILYLYVFVGGMEQWGVGGSAMCFLSPLLWRTVFRAAIHVLSIKREQAP